MPTAASITEVRKFAVSERRGNPDVSLCQCGCGRAAPLATKTCTARGYRAGDPMRFISGHNGRGRPGGPAPTPMEVKLDRHSVADPETGCIVWTGSKNKMGYGSTGHGRGNRMLAHRAAYELATGPIPEGLVIDHLCRNPSCINPDHLEAVTQRENIMRGTAPPARAAVATHCPSGHPYGGDNLYVRPNGDRVCRQCHRTHDAASRARRKAVQGGGGGDLSNTAARYVAKAMARVAPWQRSELLAAMADIVADASAHIGGVA
jgi:hypothetical protein